MELGFRSLLEYVLRDKVRLRRLPAEFGDAPIFASSAGGLGAILKPLHKIDPVLLAIARSVVRSGNVVWDVGANIGLFTVAAAALSGQTGYVFSFEPDVTLVRLLRKTADYQASSSAPITVIPCAAACEFALRHFGIAKRARASNALLGYGHSQMGEVEEIQTVVAVSLDDCARHLRPPNVLKIDVEGAELEVLAGSSEILRSVRPAVVCEVGSVNAKRVSQLLEEAGYLFFDGSKPFTAAAQSNSAMWNTVAIPREKIAILLES